MSDTMTTIELRGAERLNVLDEITTRVLSCDEAGRMRPVWDLCLGEWDWDELGGGRVDRTSAEEVAEFGRLRQGLVDSAPETVSADLSTLRELAKFVREKLEQRAPEKDKPDQRWHGRVALVMRECWDRVDRAIRDAERGEKR